MFLAIISTVFPIFAVIFLGMAVARRGVLPAATAMCLNQFVYWIALPALMFDLLARLNSDDFQFGILAGYFLAVIIGYVVCFAVRSAFFKRVDAQTAQDSLVAVFSNTGFMGLSVVAFLLPGSDLALVVVSICIILNMFVLLYTDIKLEMDRHKGEGWKKAGRNFCRAVFLNPMNSFSVLGVMVGVGGLPLPDAFLNFSRMLALTAAPCALFATGMVLHMQMAAAGRFPAGWRGRLLPVLVVKLVVLPVATYFCLRLFGVSGIVLGVVVLCNCMPSGVAAVTLAEKYQVAVRDTSLNIFLSTVVGMLSIPAVIAVLYALEVF